MYRPTPVELDQWPVTLRLFILLHKSHSPDQAGVGRGARARCLKAVQRNVVLSYVLLLYKQLTRML